jgi:hypothetical protein
MSDDYDPDDHGYSFEDVCDRLDNIEAAVRANHQEFGWVGLVIVGCLAFAGIADMWNSKLRYSSWYNVGYDQVTIQKKPTDCNFFRAPMGEKGCHYDRQVTIVKVDNSNVWGGQSISYDSGENWIHTAKNEYGMPIVSRDGGKTWSTDSVPAHAEPQVIISWDRVDEDKD